MCVASQVICPYEAARFCIINHMSRTPSTSAHKRLEGQMQLPFLAPAGQDERTIKRAFQLRLGLPVKLVLTANTSSLFTARRADDHATVRMNRVLLNASDEVIAELAEYASRGRRGGVQDTPRFWEFISQHRHAIESGARTRQLRPEGEHYDLSEIFGALNAQYFGGALACSITWGRQMGQRRSSRRTLGSYVYADRLIRINPALDRKSVPRYYMEFIVYHEMLHAAMHMEHIEAESKGARPSRPHGAEFRRRERAFHDYSRAIAYESR